MKAINKFYYPAQSELFFIICKGVRKFPSSREDLFFSWNVYTNNCACLVQLEQNFIAMLSDKNALL